MDPQNDVEKMTASPAAEVDSTDGASAAIQAPNYSNGGEPPADKDGETYKEQKVEFFRKIRVSCQKVKSDCRFDSDRDKIDQLSMKAESYRVRIKEMDPDKKAIRSVCNEFSAWIGDYTKGEQAWELMKELVAAKKAKEQREQDFLDREKQDMQDRATAIAANNAVSDECRAVYADMNRQYSLWNGLGGRDRGAYWGSDRPGTSRNAVSVPDDVIRELQRYANPRDRWVFSNSDSSGLSFKRVKGGISFIYHLKPPNN